MKELLERRTKQSARHLRELSGQVRLDPTTGDIRRPYYVASTSIDCVLLKPPAGEGPDGGSSTLRQWSRRELNPRPRTDPPVPLRA